ARGKGDGCRRPPSPALRLSRALSPSKTLSVGGSFDARGFRLMRPDQAEKKAIMKTREERSEELKRLAARPNGINKLYLVLTRNFIPFEKLPIGSLLIEAILDHEYPKRT